MQTTTENYRESLRDMMSYAALQTVTAHFGIDVDKRVPSEHCTGGVTIRDSKNLPQIGYSYSTLIKRSLHDACTSCMLTMMKKSSPEDQMRALELVADQFSDGVENNTPNAYQKVGDLRVTDEDGFILVYVEYTSDVSEACRKAMKILMDSLTRIPSEEIEGL